MSKYEWRTHKHVVEKEWTNEQKENEHEKLEIRMDLCANVEREENFLVIMEMLFRFFSFFLTLSTLLLLSLALRTSTGVLNKISLLLHMILFSFGSFVFFFFELIYFDFDAKPNYNWATTNRNVLDYD